MKINRACILALSAFFVVSEGSEASDDIPNLRRELGVPFYFKVLDCNKDMVDVEVCFRTDEWPGESVVSIEDEDDEIGFEFGPFTKKEKVYCEEDRFCPGKVSKKYPSRYGMLHVYYTFEFCLPGLQFTFHTISFVHNNILVLAHHYRQCRRWNKFKLWRDHYSS